MKILAFDTSTKHLSVTLFDDEKTVFNSVVTTDGRVSNLLLPEIQKGLKSVNWSLNDLNVCAVGLGPGSFTGLRIGLATAKSLAYALNISLMGFSSFEMAAMSVQQDGELAIAFDARRGKYYSAVFQKDNEELSVVKPPALVEAQAFEDRYPDVHFQDRVLTESIFPLVQNKIKHQISDDPLTLSPVYLYPDDCMVQKKS